MVIVPTLPVLTGVTADSREVAPGYAFVALKGEKMDGISFVKEAVQKGASVIVAADEAAGKGLPPHVSFIHSENPRLMLSMLAAHFYHAAPATMVAVTGTNGKTSTVHFYRSFFTLMGKKSASIGTLGVVDPERRYADYQGPSLTTPNPVLLHKILYELADDEVEYAALEASSHGLDQYRLDGVDLTAAAFTNLSRDHLDYHGTIQQYFAAKAQLFGRVLQPGRTAVLNSDVPEFAALQTLCRQRNQPIIDYGRKAEHIRIESLKAVASGQQLKLCVNGASYMLSVPLVGEFQIYNVLCALGLVLASGVSKARCVPLIERLLPVPGRMEKVTGDSVKHVFVDYAHTPDALEKALLALRPHTSGKLKVVFGCGGDRDTGKRPQMGAIAAMLADEIVVTDDNPRSEVPKHIRSAIISGCNAALETSERQVTVREIEGRKEAITEAVSTLMPEDSLLIAGKGHEKTQVIGSEVIPFDDVQVVTSIIRKR